MFLGVHVHWVLMSKAKTSYVSVETVFQCTIVLQHPMSLIVHDRFIEELWCDQLKEFSKFVNWINQMNKL
jgi:hypothetical protein